MLRCGRAKMGLSCVCRADLERGEKAHIPYEQGKKMPRRKLVHYLI
jgi:hypothetical protein